MITTTSLARRQPQTSMELTNRVLQKILRADPAKYRADPDQLKRVVARRLMKLIPNFHTPVHPTYAFMIHRAISELNADGGSDRESISAFIKNEYGDLPLAHGSILTAQLKKLCEKGEIFVTDGELYVLSLGDSFVEKQVLKEDGEPAGEKSNVVEGSPGKGSVLMEHEAADGPHKVNVSCKKQNGLVTRRRWSIRLQSKIPQEDETKEDHSERVEVASKARGEKDTTRDERYLFGLLEDPLEPPGFPSKKDRLIQDGVEVEQKKIVQQKIQAEDNTLQAEKDETNADILLPCVCGKSKAHDVQLILSTDDAVTMFAKPISVAFSTPDNEPFDKQQIPMRRGRGRPRKQIPDGGSLVTKKKEKKQLTDVVSKNQEKKQGRGRPRKQKSNELPKMEDIENGTEIVAENALAIWDHNQHQPKATIAENSLNSARRGSSSNRKPGTLVSSQAPKPAVNASLSESPSVCKTLKKNAAAPWDWEVVTKHVSRQNSISVDGVTLASASGSQDKEGAKKCKRIERSLKIVEDVHSGSKESPKMKPKGWKRIRYTDVSITDLVYCQDHHI